MQMSKENYERLQTLVERGISGEAALHPKALKAYQDQLESADVKRGPGRPPKAEAEEPPHSDYVPETGEEPATET